MKEKQVSLYTRQTDITGGASNPREVIYVKFGRDIKAICELRELDPCDPGYKAKAAPIKQRLQLWAPSALLASRAAGNVRVVKRTNIMQLDFDYDAIKDFDIEELKQCVFALHWFLWVVMQW